MKTIKKFASLLLFAGVLASCQKEIVVETLTTDSPTTFSAALEEQPQSRVTIDGFAPKFEIGDVLNVTASNNATASFKVTEVSASGVATLDIDGSWSAEPTAPYFIYNGTPSFILPAAGILNFSAPNNVIDAKANSLDNMTFVAKANSLENVTMLNASCLIKIVVPESVRDIKVAPASGDITTVAGINLTSAININQASYGPVEVKYSGHNGLGLTPGTYYIPLFPQTFNGGVRVGYSIDGEEYIWREKSGDFTFQRNKIYDMGTLADWVVVTPVYTIDDLVGDYTGTVKIGMSNNGVVSGNPTELAFTVAASDDSSKGNVMFTQFAGVTGNIYAQFDLVTGTVTLPVGSVFASSFGSVTFTEPMVLSFNAESKTLSLNDTAIVGSFPPIPSYGYGFSPFTLTKVIPTPPVTVADFVGTFKGNYRANYNLNPAGVSDLADVEFVFEEADQDGCNIKLVSVGGLSSNALGTLDLETGLLVFASGQRIPYPDNRVITSAAPLGDALQLQFSADKNTITLVNNPCLINAMAYPSFCPQIIGITLSRSNGGSSAGFSLADLLDNTYSVSCKINGTSYSGSMTATSTGASGANVYLLNVFGTANGYQSDAFVFFDVETGYITFGKTTATNRVTLPFSLDTWHQNTAMGDNILVMSADKSTITIHEDCGGLLMFYDGSENLATVTDFTATLSK